MNNKRKEQRSSTISLKQNDNAGHFERVSNIVNEWPEWKKSVWGPVILNVNGGTLSHE